MYKNLTLRNRIFLISTALVVVAFALMWIFIRPEYKKAIINERTTIVSQLQEYSLQRVDETIRNWSNSVKYLSEDIVQEPGLLEVIARRAINYTPGLIKISISEIGSTQTVDFSRTIYEELSFPDIISNWYESKIDPKTVITWKFDRNQDFNFFIAQRTLQIDTVNENNISDPIFLKLTVYFNANKIASDLRNIPLGGEYSANIFTENKERIFQDSNKVIPDEFVKDGSYSNHTTIEWNGNSWFILYSRFQSIPFFHTIAVKNDFIVEPVKNLVLFSALAAAGILALVLMFNFYVSLRVNKPIDHILTDIDHMGKLDFNKSIREVDLPEFKNMRETLENIRITLRRYQKINVEKIILEEWKNRYMMTYSEDMIGILDNSGKFRFLNNHFIEMIENFGKNPHDITFEEILSSPQIEVEKSIKNLHSPNPYSVTIERAELAHSIDDQTTYYYDYQYVSFEDEEEKPQGALVILHDKTKDRIVDMKRNDMINIIIHELKNPIAGIIGLVRLMIDNANLSLNDQRDLLKEIYLSGERMNDLVNRFLDVQRLEYGRIPIKFTNIDLHQIVKEVTSVSNSLLKTKNLSINLVVTKGSTFTAKGSRDLIFDAVQNLVSNAIKYGDKDRTIDIVLNSTKEKVEVSVIDYGFGISVEDQKKVFDKFFRVRTNIKSAREKGSGLGLAYVKEIISKHKGDIHLESNDEFGSKFTIVLLRNFAELNE
jgi:signal transduction histidine kinase